MLENYVQISGELYKFSNKSPAKNLRTPGKSERRPLADTGNTPRGQRSRERSKDEQASTASKERRERDKSVNRKAREEMKKQLNLSYFQVDYLKHLPSFPLFKSLS